MEPVTKQAVVEQKIGRNLILFQKIEYILKFLLSRCKIEGFPDEVKTIIEKNGDAVKNKSFGQLISSEFEDLFLSETQNDRGSVEIGSGKVFVNLSISMEKNDILSLKEQLSDIKNRRNELVHHLIPMLYPKSQEKILFLENYLDSQQESFQSVFKDLLSIREAFEESNDEVFRVISSEEYQRAIAYHDLISGIVQLLFDISKENNGGKNWILLNYAGRALQKQYPGWVTTFARFHNIRSLKELILNIDSFEIKTDSFAKNAKTYYRIKNEFRAFQSILIESNSSVNGTSVTSSF